MDALGLEDDRAPRPRWTLVDLRALPEPFWRAALRMTREAARREHLALDLQGFVPAAAAILDLQGRSTGEPVATIRRWRGVGAVRLGGTSTLLVAEVDALDDESLDSALAGERLRVFLVTRAGMGDADRVALAEQTGYRI